MKDLTSSVYTFENLINGNFLYVDKTEYIWNLIRLPYAQYFLSRPRRFGKSLTISTLEAVFQGKKELFKGLALYDKPYDWKQYPVIHLDFANCDAKTPEALTEFLMDQLEIVAEKHQITPRFDQLTTRFEALIRDIAGQEKVVILIDEYDKPILGNVRNPRIQEILQVLKGFFGNIKKSEPLQRFVFLTGVSKFSHVSVFSDLNNLTDISMEVNYATMLGYTQDELESYFGDRIEVLLQQTEDSKEELLTQIKSWYNGYRFEETAPTVYNPVSLAQFFENGGKFNNYWFQTGTPTFLLELMKEREFNYVEALETPVSDTFFNSSDFFNLDPMTLLFETGYLTIDRMDNAKIPFTNESIRKYYLRFPNKEVERSFTEKLIEITNISS